MTAIPTSLIGNIYDYDTTIIPTGFLDIKYTEYDDNVTESQ